MASTMMFNLQGMDSSNPFGNGCSYLQDVHIEDSCVWERYPIPAVSGMTAMNPPATIAGNVGAVSVSGNFYTMTPGTGWGSAYSTTYPVSGNGTSQIGVYTDRNLGDDTGWSTARVGNEVIFADPDNGRDNTYASMSCWAGSTKTSTLNSTTSTRTASTTANSRNVTFSGAVTGLDSTWVNAYIYLSGFPKRPFRITKVISTTVIVIDTQVDFTTASQTWCIQPVAWVGSQDGVFAYDNAGTYTALNEVHAKVACGHQSRLFAMNGYDGATRVPHRVWYSGTTADVNSSYIGIHNWYANSWFDAAPELGEEILAAHSFGGDLIIFKNKGICVLRGVVANNDSTKFGARVDILSGELKLLGAASAVVTPVGVYAYCEDGVYIVTGSSVDKISSKIDSFLTLNAKRENRVYSPYHPHSFVMSGYVYTRIGIPFYPDGVVANGYYWRYLVWDYRRNEFHIRTLPLKTAPNGAVEIFYPTDKTFYTITTTSSTTALLYGGDSENAPSAPGWGTADATGDNPTMQIVTNSLSSNEGYPGYLRPVVLHIVQAVPAEGIFAFAYPGYGSTALIEPDLGSQAANGTIDPSVNISSVTYDLSIRDKAYAERIGCASVPPSYLMPIVIANSFENSGSTFYSQIYAVGADYEFSDNVAP